jgi:hypothetical protein
MQILVNLRAGLLRKIGQQLERPCMSTGTEGDYWLEVFVFLSMAAEEMHAGSLSP